MCVCVCLFLVAWSVGFPHPRCEDHDFNFWPHFNFFVSVLANTIAPPPVSVLDVWCLPVFHVFNYEHKNQRHFGFVEVTCCEPRAFGAPAKIRQSACDLAAIGAIWRRMQRIACNQVKSISCTLRLINKPWLA